MRLFSRIGVLAGLILAGCAPAPRGLPEIAAFPSPDDPAIVSPMRGASSVVGAYTPRSVVEPRGWRDRGVPLQAVPEAGR